MTSCAVVEGLPGGPPGAFELDAVARGAGELVERDAEGLGEALGDAEGRLLLAALVAVDLARVDAGGGREAGLREAGFLAEPPDDLAEVGWVFAGFHGLRSSYGRISR